MLPLNLNHVTDDAQPTLSPARSRHDRMAFVARLLEELPALQRRAQHLERARHPAFDLLHDTVERGLTRWDRFRPGTNLRSWLFTIMQNLLRDRCRQRCKTTFKQSYLDQLANREAPSGCEESSVATRLGPADLHSAAARLPQPLRDTFELVALRQMSYRQAADQLGVAVATIGTRAFRARARMRVLLLERLDREPPGLQGITTNLSRATLIFVCLLGAGLATLGCSPDTPSAVDSNLEAIVSPLTLAASCTGNACDSVVRGAFAFIDRRPRGHNGNGRACADCHVPSDAFQLSPGRAEARFQALQARRRYNPAADDPLFRPIDADDFRSRGDSASDYSNLRQNGLVRVTFPLPPTLKVVDPMTGAPSPATFVDVWRAVPTVNNVKLTGPDPDPPSWPCLPGGPPGPACVPRGPNPNGGYQYDARITNLQEQAQGAFTNHAQVRGTLSPRILDDLANFQNALFSSPGVAAASRASDEGLSPVPDPDPPLDALEQQGKKIFTRACATCHAEAAGMHPMAGIDRFGDIMTNCPRPVDGPQFRGYAGTVRFAFAPCPPRLARNVHLYEITLPNGSKTRRLSSDPGRALSTGVFTGGGPGDDWQALDVPSTRGSGKTAPYFHNNSAATLEDVLDHYTEFFRFVAALVPLVDPSGRPIPRPPFLSTDGVRVDRPFSTDERPALLAYLRKH
jgi:RNA polymerase sigma factor (sigma-70 family)